MSRWADAWPDALAFAIGLGLAWWLKWSTTDLVWSLWLSSLGVGYALIVWTISAPLRELVGNIAGDTSPTAGAGPKSLVVILFIGGTLFGLAFFTVHFGGFHFVHSVFLMTFFPLEGEPMSGFPTLATYVEVVQRYWIFLPVAFIAERATFRGMSGAPTARTASPEEIAARTVHGDRMMLPYRAVIRMHLLIFFFFAANLLNLESFVVYAVVYAVYFFPWRLLRRADGQP